MKWFVNDSSLQGQFADRGAFRDRLRQLIELRTRHPRLKDSLRVSAMIPRSPVDGSATVSDVVFEANDRDLARAVMSWFDRTGPFIEDDQAAEDDDYFEYEGLEVTRNGLGEAARRRKSGEDCATFSFEGGTIDFAVDPLVTHHGLVEERLGVYEVDNRWDTARLEDDIRDTCAPPANWTELVAVARERFPHLDIADLDQARDLAREPFQHSIANSALSLMGYLERYAADRRPDGSAGPNGSEVIKQFFNGDRALFSNESAGNIAEFREEMTFQSPDGRRVFAPWHGKISHRYFRLHFEWPFTPERDRLAVLYLGPKITKG
ncbi:MAG: hypothetical protein ACK4ZJ_02560 [Allorhizobium sp.]